MFHVHPSMDECWINEMYMYVCKDDTEPCTAALQWNSQGTRVRGRPRNSWQRTTLNESGKHSWSDLRLIARSREGWRRFVDNLMFLMELRTLLLLLLT
jgi:hypothetical protein